jgi:cytochrome c oxidase subunit 3
MQRDAAARVTPEGGRHLTLIPGYGAGPPRGAAAPVVSNARLAVIMLLAAEAMLFMGLIGAYLVFRMGSAAWPPPDQPRLPLAVTWTNTVVLLVSAYTMQGALRAARAGAERGLVRRLVWTALLGLVFLGVQGSEWVRLVQHGLTLASGTYGATFYTLVGLHGAHVLAAVVWLLAVLAGAGARRFSARRHAAVDLCAIYWNFVVGLWVVLFTLVYLV